MRGEAGDGEIGEVFGKVDEKMPYSWRGDVGHHEVWRVDSCMHCCLLGVQGVWERKLLQEIIITLHRQLGNLFLLLLLCILLLLNMAS